MGWRLHTVHVIVADELESKFFRSNHAKPRPTLIKLIQIAFRKTFDVLSSHLILFFIVIFLKAAHLVIF